MAFGKRGLGQQTKGPGREEAAISQNNDITAVNTIDSSGTGQLIKLFVGAFVAVLGLQAIYFAGMPTLFSWVSEEGDTARQDPPPADKTKPRSGVNYNGPAYVERKLGFKSAVDQQCARLWKDVEIAGFRESMLCYGTKNISRLCDAKEREAFVLLVDEYLEFERAHRLHWKMMTGGVEIPMGPAGNPLGSKDVIKSWRVLAEKGYISLEDFGWGAPGVVKQAIGDVAAKNKPCSQG